MGGDPYLKSDPDGYREEVGSRKSESGKRKSEVGIERVGRLEEWKSGRVEECKSKIGRTSSFWGRVLKGRHIPGRDVSPALSIIRPLFEVGSRTVGIERRERLEECKSVRVRT